VSTRHTPLALGLVALLLWLAFGAAPPLRLDVGAAGDERFLWGFYDAEAGDGASFRWSGPDARLLLHGAPPGAALLALRLSGERLAAQGEPAVALARGDGPLVRFDVAPGWRVYRVLLPPGSLAAPGAAAAPLALRSALSTPGAAEAARDYRSLGVPLDWLELTRLRGQPDGALARALWLTWAVGVLAALAGLASGAAGARRHRAALLAGGLGALLALLWAWRDPYGLAWALPATPWALGCATLLLAGRELWRRGAPRLRAAPLLGCFALLAAAVGLMHAHVALGLSLALGVAALLALGAPADGLGAGAWEGPPQPPARFVIAGLATVMLLALALRLYRIGELPFGLWRDEARHGLVALRIAEDPAYRPVYVLEERVHLPGLGLYPFAAALKLFGAHLWTMRLVTALAGALTALPLYAVAARLTGSRAVALVSALLLAASSWHVSISRFSFPTIYEPLLSLSAWWLLLVALGGGQGPQHPREALGAPGSNRLAGWQAAAWGLLAGVLLGVAAQTYHIGRVTPLAAGWLALLLLVRAPQHWRRWSAVVCAAALGLALTLAPLLGYALTRPDDFNDRVGDVFLLGEGGRRGEAPLAALDASLGRHLLMFTYEGDANGRHHAPYRPMLDILSGLGLLVGVAALLRRAADWRSRFLLGACAIGLLPSLLAVDSPHGMRSFGALAPACVIAALGWREVARMAPLGRLAFAPRRLSLAVFVAGLVGLNAWLYFVLMPRDPQVFAGFYPVQSQMGIYVGAAPPGERIFVPAEVRSHPSFALLAAGHQVEAFSAEAPGPAELSARPGPGDSLLLSGYFADEEAAALTRALGSPPVRALEGPPFPDGSGSTYVVERAP
jgi:4-amino-4-deoxy-L-arabinose transferase-like glycosyltransferase